LREAFFFQIEADVVGADVGEIGEGLIETEDEEEGKALDRIYGLMYKS